MSDRRADQRNIELRSSDVVRKSDAFMMLTIKKCQLTYVGLSSPYGDLTHLPFRMRRIACKALTRLNDINASGDVVGFYYDTAFTAHGFLWSRGVYNKMDIPGSIGTRTWGINDRGDIVGSYLTGDGMWHGFVTYKHPR